jgi:hypothetical protein
MTDKKRTFALYMGMKSIEAERGGNAGHLGVVEINESGTIRNPETGHAFNDLNFRCQWHEKMGETFAWRVDYDTSRVELADAERMAKLLRKAWRVERKFSVNPTTFGQFCVLMAKGLGITKLVKRVGGYGLSFADNEHRTFSIVEAQGVIDSAIAESRTEAAA